LKKVNFLQIFLIIIYNFSFYFIFFTLEKNQKLENNSKQPDGDEIHIDLEENENENSEKAKYENIISEFVEKFDTVNNLLNSKDFQILTKYSENLNSGKKRKDNSSKNKANLEKYGK